MALTKRQKQVLDFISRFRAENGYSPSYQEIADGLGLSSLATVHKHIAALEAKQYLKRSFNRSRSIDLTAKYYQEERRRRRAGSFEIPLAGRIAAGLPIEAIAGRDSLDLSDLLADENLFALEVRGQSMAGEHIVDGDIVLVERNARVQDGDIVVALIGGSEATLKRFFRQDDGTVVLRGAGENVPPIRVPASDLNIQGRVLAVLRKYR